MRLVVLYACLLNILFFACSTATCCFAKGLTSYTLFCGLNVLHVVLGRLNDLHVILCIILSSNEILVLYFASSFFLFLLVTALVTIVY